MVLKGFMVKINSPFPFIPTPRDNLLVILVFLSDSYCQSFR